MKDERGYKLHPDGTRVGDNCLQRLRDRINGTAQRNLDRWHSRRLRADLDRNRDAIHARMPGKSGCRRWMKPFAKVDMFGRPTVFSNRRD